MHTGTAASGTSQTVVNRGSNIFAKLQAANWAETIIRARDAGLGGVSGSPHIHNFLLMQNP